MNGTLGLALEIKALSGRQFEGHGSIFGNVDLGGDIVVPGAFKRSLAQHKAAGTLPLMYWMHKSDQVAGAWLEMSEDTKGLYVRGELADTQLGNEIRTLLGMKAVRGLSIGYVTRDSDFDDDGNRLLKEVELWEVSIVSQAMNPLARVEASKARLSSTGEYVPTERELETILRKIGMSRKVAKHMCAKMFDADTSGGTPLETTRWDAEAEEAEAIALIKAIEGLTDRIGAQAINHIRG